MTTLFGHPRDLPASAFAKAESPFRDRGTDGSNPSLSSSESSANPLFSKSVAQFTRHSGWRLPLAGDDRPSGLV